MRCNFITIEREYGSGGTKVARRLSQAAGIPCYGHEILEAVARRLDLTVESVECYEESVSRSLLYTIALMGQSSGERMRSLSPEDQVFLEEQSEIRRLAGGGPAIFLGHCASEALRDRKGVVRVFIHADEADKRARILEDYGIPEESVEAIRKRFDKKRANYYFANTAKRWSDLKNYDLVLNTSTLGVDGCAAALKGLLAGV